MPHICTGEENNIDMLILPAVDRAGQLYDPATVEYEVYEGDPADLAATKVYPPAGRVDMAGEQTHPGIYVAWDTTNDHGLKPGTSWAATEGALHFIRWYFADEDAPATIHTWDQPFYVEAAGLELGFWSYVSPTEIRGEGLSASSVSDAWLLKLMRRAQALVDRKCRTPFRPVYHDFLVNAHDDSQLRLPMPIVGIEEILSNYSTQALDTDSYHVYANPVTRRRPGPVPVDYRKNPRVHMTSQPSIYRAGVAWGRRGLFVDEPAAHRVKGLFGYLEPNGATPELITRAMMELVFKTAERFTAGNSSPSVANGPLKWLKVDRHEQEWDNAASSVGLTSALAMTPAVEEILNLYKMPMAMEVSG